MTCVRSSRNSPGAPGSKITRLGLFGRFARGSHTGERQKIDALDGVALVRYAIMLKRLASQARIRRQLVALVPTSELISAKRVEITDDGTQNPLPKRVHVDDLSAQLSRVAAIAKRPWQDLANIADYFEPRPEFVKTADGQLLQRGELIVSLNPALHPVGNFIVRCMLRRVDMMVELLGALRAKTLRVLAGNPHYYSKLAEAEVAWTTLQSSYAAAEKDVRDWPPITNCATRA